MNRVILFSWIGAADMGMFLRGDGTGPLQRFCRLHPADHIILLSPHDKEEGAAYKRALEEKTGAAITAVNIPVTEERDIQGMYNSVLAVLRYAQEHFTSEDGWEFFLTSGGTAATALWLLAPLTLGDTPCRYWYLSEEGLPRRWRPLLEPDDRLLYLPADEFSPAAESPPGRSRGERARCLLEKAGYVALRSSYASPPELWLPHLFPRKKPHRRKVDELVAGGEVGPPSAINLISYPEELPHRDQIRLRDYLKDSPRSTVILCRISLTEGVSRGLIIPTLADLLGRSALELPDMPEDRQELNRMIHRIMDRLNDEYALRESFHKKGLTSPLIYYLTSQPTPFATLKDMADALEQAYLLSAGEETLNPADVETLALERGRREPFTTSQPAGKGKPAFPHETSGPLRNPLEYPLEEGVDLRERLSEVARYYLTKAMRVTGGNKTRSAELLGLHHYQTLTNWLKKYGLEEIGD